jgi:Family of unknown function (DUF6152)
MRIPQMATFCVIGLALAVVPLRAHHAFTSEFDANQPVKLRGTVTKIELVNPHSWIHIDVKDPDGKVTNWAIEGGTPNTLFRLGINKNSLPIGAELLVDGYRAKDGSNKANGRDITFADGRKIFIGGSSPGAPPR